MADGKNVAEKLDERLENLDRKIWITRKCRIEAAERLKKKNDFYQFVIVYYSILLVIVSIINIDSNNTYFSLLVLSLSIVLSLFSLFITSKNLLDRYHNLKHNYIKLAEFLDELDQIKVNQQLDYNVSDFKKNLNTINDKYLTTLSAVENHEEIDLMRFKKKHKEKADMDLPETNAIEYYIYMTKNITSMILLVSAPLLIAFFWWVI